MKTRHYCITSRNNFIQREFKWKIYLTSTHILVTYILIIKYDIIKAQNSLLQSQPNFWPPLCVTPMTTNHTHKETRENLLEMVFLEIRKMKKTKYVR